MALAKTATENLCSELDELSALGQMPQMAALLVRQL
jgi:hypothetical protein